MKGSENMINGQANSSSGMVTNDKCKLRFLEFEARRSHQFIMETIILHVKTEYFLRRTPVPSVFLLDEK